MRDPRAALPKLTRLLRPELVARYGQARVVDAARALLAQAREAKPIPSEEALQAALLGSLSVGVVPVLNATGVLLHTNLGRAPWPALARERVAQITAGYCSAELDLATGKRGGRGAGVEARLRALTGAEGALVVNNGAAGLFLALSALASGRPVLVSRGEAVEIGGGFRIPDVCRQTGAKLVEVGTTNRTHLKDYEAALVEHPDAALILRVHTSNFRLEGFVCRPSLGELATLGVPVLSDLGSGAVSPQFEEPTFQEELAGAALVSASGDKLLGGPQAGLLLGQAALLKRLAEHPLMRVLRPGKETLAALEGTLDAWLTGASVPLRDMVEAPLDALHEAALAWRKALPAWVKAEVRPVEGAIGGGSLPGRTWASVALVISEPGPEALRAALLKSSPPVVGRIQGGALWLDARAVVPLGQSDALFASLLEALSATQPASSPEEDPKPHR